MKNLTPYYVYETSDSIKKILYLHSDGLFLNGTSPERYWKCEKVEVPYDKYLQLPKNILVEIINSYIIDCGSVALNWDIKKQLDDFLVDLIPDRNFLLDYEEKYILDYVIDVVVKDFTKHATIEDIIKLYHCEKFMAAIKPEHLKQIRLL